MALLMEMNTKEIRRINADGISGELLGEAISRMRRGEVSITPGYDGEYGVVRIGKPFERNESD